jgi:hypothetical protein
VFVSRLVFVGISRFTDTVTVQRSGSIALGLRAGISNGIFAFVMTVRIALATILVLVTLSGHYFSADTSFATDAIAQRSKNSEAPGLQRTVRFSGEVLKGRSKSQ